MTLKEQLATGNYIHIPKTWLYNTIEIETMVDNQKVIGTLNCITDHVIQVNKELYSRRFITRMRII